jgi:DNA-binding PadR family transcriptional regulator
MKHGDSEREDGDGWHRNPWNFERFGNDWRMRFGQRGWLRPLVFRLLEEKPMNGIEIMNRMQEMSQGWWRPSPGSIYPLLDTLATEGLARKRQDGRYELTQEYRKERGPASQVDQVLASMESEVSYLQELAQSNRKEFEEHKKKIMEIAQRLSKLK